MSERDSVHKEIEKLQEEVAETKRRAAALEGKNREKDEEVRWCRVAIRGTLVFFDKQNLHSAKRCTTSE